MLGFTQTERRALWKETETLIGAYNTVNCVVVAMMLATHTRKKKKKAQRTSMRQTDVLLCSFKEGFCAACFGLAGCEEDRVFELATGDYIAYSLIDIG